MLFLNKLLPVFVLPIGVITLLIVLGALKRWRWMSFVAAGALLLGSLPVVSNVLLGSLEAVYAPRSVGSLPEADAVLVLGGIMAPMKSTSSITEWSEAVERFEAGITIVQLGKAGQLLFTGDARGSEGTALQREAVIRGVPAKQVAVIGAVGNTVDEAEQFRRYAAQHGLKRVVLVTSSWHMPRSMRLFRGAGVEIVPFPVDFRTLPNRSLPYLDYMPTAGALEKTELALRESYGIAFYSVFGK